MACCKEIPFPLLSEVLFMMTQVNEVALVFILSSTAISKIMDPFHFRKLSSKVWNDDIQEGIHSCSCVLSGVTHYTNIAMLKSSVS